MEGVMYVNVENVGTIVFIYQKKMESEDKLSGSVERHGKKL